MKYSTTDSIVQAYIENGWRQNVLKQEERGVHFIIGKSSGSTLWNLENTEKVIDCGIAGGVHSLGHRNPDVLDALRAAIDRDHLDTGLWAFANRQYLELQDALVKYSNIESLTRIVVTHCSTISVDLAIMFARRLAKKRKILAYRNGYHGHSGNAAIVTGSESEGVIEYYGLPQDEVEFFDSFNSVDEIRKKIGDDTAAVITEPMQYEDFSPSSKEFFNAIREYCKEKGALFIVDETRTGLGRTGTFWATEQLDIVPDILITGKGLSGGIYPVSALLMNSKDFDRCMNEHRYAYLSSLGGNPIACAIATKVVEMTGNREFLASVRQLESRLKDMLNAVCRRNPDIFNIGTNWGGLATLKLERGEDATRVYGLAFNSGLLIHSVSETTPYTVKLLPPLTVNDEDIRNIETALDKTAGLLRGSD